MNVLFRYNCAPWLREHLAGLAEQGLHVQVCGEADDEAYSRLLRDADALWHVLRPVTAPAIAGAGRLRLIQKIGVGVNTIDIDAAVARNVAVCNMPGTNTQAVAELALSLLLACLRRLVAFDAETRRGQGWCWPTAWQEDLTEVAGKTVGLVGFGAVPQRLAPILAAMGADVIFWNRTLRPESEYRQVDKVALLAGADVVSLHLPLSQETQHWLDAPSIAALRPGAIVVNTARGGLIDQAALIDALRSHHLRAAGLDVFADEPIPATDPLLRLDNVVVTPHVAWLTRDTLERSLGVAVDNVSRLASGRPLLHRVA